MESGRSSKKMERKGECKGVAPCEGVLAKCLPSGHFDHVTDSVDSQPNLTRLRIEISLVALFFFCEFGFKLDGFIEAPNDRTHTNTSSSTTCTITALHVQSFAVVIFLLRFFWAIRPSLLACP